MLFFWRVNHNDWPYFVSYSKQLHIFYRSSFVALGTGLLKPNIGALVGQLYRANDKRLEAGYALYYMGINIGSLIGYLVCGWIQINLSYHALWSSCFRYGHRLIQFKFTAYRLEELATKPAQPFSVCKQTSKFLILMFLLTVILPYINKCRSNRLIQIGSATSNCHNSFIICYVFRRLFFYGSIKFK